MKKEENKENKKKKVKKEKKEKVTIKRFMVTLVKEQEEIVYLDFFPYKGILETLGFVGFRVKEVIDLFEKPTTTKPEIKPYTYNKPNQPSPSKKPNNKPDTSKPDTSKPDTSTFRKFADGKEYCETNINKFCNCEKLIEKSESRHICEIHGRFSLAKNGKWLYFPENNEQKQWYQNQDQVPY